MPTEAQQQHHREASLDNSRKLDELIQLIKGEQDAPGVLARLSLHEEVLFGSRGNGGLIHKVNMMWKIHTWLLCTLSAGAGFMLREILLLLIKKP